MSRVRQDGVRPACADNRRLEEQLEQAWRGGSNEGTIAGFMDLVEASKHYPCIKTAWVEHLGEHLEPATARID